MNFLKRLLSKSNNSDGKSDKEDKAFFHEDLYCQVEIVPRENGERLKQENEKIFDFSNQHKDGFGYSDIFVRDEPNIKTEERKIEVSEFEGLILTNGFEKILKVYTGYGSYEEICKSVIAYRLDGASIYCDYENHKIKNIWIDGFRFNGDSIYKDTMVSCLNQIGMRWSLVLNDWDLCETIDLNQPEEILKYIHES